MRRSSRRRSALSGPLPRCWVNIIIAAIAALFHPFAPAARSGSPDPRSLGLSNRGGLTLGAGGEREGAWGEAAARRGLGNPHRRASVCLLRRREKKMEQSWQERFFFFSTSKRPSSSPSSSPLLFFPFFSLLFQFPSRFAFVLSENALIGRFAHCYTSASCVIFRRGGERKGQKAIPFSSFTINASVFFFGRMLPARVAAVGAVPPAF